MAISRLSETTLQTGFQKFNTLWDGRSAVGAMDAISGVTLSTTTSSIIFNNIPQTYSSLHIRAVSQVSTDDADFSLRFNDDSNTNYTKYQMYGDGTAVAAVGSLSQSGIPGGVSWNAVANSFGIAIIDIADYSNSNKNTTVKVLTGRDDNSRGTIFLRGGIWLNTSPVTSITIYASSGASLINTNSSFSLYGIK